MIKSPVIINILIFLLLGMGFVGIWPLVYNEFTYGSTCPKLFGIPACYIVLLCLILISLSFLNVKRHLLYYLGAGIASGIALIGTIGNLLGKLQCPQTDSAIPMCYLSLGLFISLLILMHLKHKTAPKSV